MRDGIVRLWFDVAPDSLPLANHVFVTVCVVVTCATVGVFCSQVEVVLAYKGGIFGSMMVYILPALFHTAIAEQTLDNLITSANSPTKPLFEIDNFGRRARPRYSLPQESAPYTFGSTIVALFSARQHRLSACLFAWGVGSGILSVAVTVLKQLGNIN